MVAAAGLRGHHLDGSGTLSGTFAQVSLAGFASGAFNVVPEPGTYGLSLAGLGVMALLMRQRRPAT